MTPPSAAVMSATLDTWIRGAMDTTADPYEDFFQDTCGGYLRTHSLPPADLQPLCSGVKFAGPSTLNGRSFFRPHREQQACTADWIRWSHEWARAIRQAPRSGSAATLTARALMVTHGKHAGRGPRELVVIIASGDALSDILAESPNKASSNCASPTGPPHVTSTMLWLGDVQPMLPRSRCAMTRPFSFVCVVAGWLRCCCSAPRGSALLVCLTSPTRALQWPSAISQSAAHSPPACLPARPSHLPYRFAHACAVHAATLHSRSNQLRRARARS